MYLPYFAVFNLCSSENIKDIGQFYTDELAKSNIEGNC